MRSSDPKWLNPNHFGLSNGSLTPQLLRNKSSIRHKCSESWTPPLHQLLTTAIVEMVTGWWSTFALWFWRQQCKANNTVWIVLQKQDQMTRDRMLIPSTGEREVCIFPAHTHTCVENRCPKHIRKRGVVLSSSKMYIAGFVQWNDVTMLMHR